MLASLLKLLSRYSQEPQPALAYMITRQLDVISRHPDATGFPLIKSVTERLYVQWEGRTQEKTLVEQKCTGKLH